MAYDSKVDVTFDTAIDDFIAAISGMADWSVVRDHTDGTTDSNNDGEYIVFEYAGSSITPNVFISFGDENDYDYNQELETGTWDDANLSMNSDAGEILNFYQISRSSNVHYDMGYVNDRGFWFRVDEDTGASGDTTEYFGVGVVEKIWDDSGADSPNAELVVTHNPRETEYHAAPHPNDDERYEDMNWGGVGGMNPDPNDDSVIWTEWILRSSYQSNSWPQQFGKHSMWITDNGSGFANGDIVQDSSGNDLFVFFSGGLWRIA
ncbi:hypothetical protein [Natronosalvus halobius]|uniref:hypothetical protein n=1 Tax=Natronosalvus halobius TaxID=2953746 RepID=UPI00209DAE92|nr:hypothetical protein [Natronosalvus halobius]USZ73232.1 hypothetical protein NGM15_08030 [Natronosalvus halobius]